MFMTINAEISTEEIMQKMLQSHSLNYVLYLALKTYGYESAEFLSDKMTKIVEECDE